MKQNPPEGVSASPLSDENIYVWGGTIFGTDDTAWEGGIFSMRLTFPEQYPDKPPRVRFTSEMVSHLPCKGIWFFPWARLAASGCANACTCLPASACACLPACLLGDMPSRPRLCAVPPEHLPGRHAVLGLDSRQLESNLFRVLHHDRDPLSAH